MYLSLKIRIEGIEKKNKLTEMQIEMNLFSQPVQHRMTAKSGHG